jgi:imidazolonepropionase-like amidohydrolase
MMRDPLKFVPLLIVPALAFSCTLIYGASDLAPAIKKGGTLAITGGKLLTVSHGTIENGVLLIVDGKITAVGASGSVPVPKDATIVDAHGLTVYPGLIDPDTTLGLTEVGADAMSNDMSEPSDEIMPHMHVADAFHAETELIPVARLNGVTNAVVAPGTEDSVAGQDIFIQLAGRNRDAMILGRDVALAMNYGADQRRRGGRGSSQYPSTRMGLITQLRQNLLDAQHYEGDRDAAEKKSDKSSDGSTSPAPEKAADKSSKSSDKPAGKGGDKPFQRDLKMEALLPYLHGEKPVVVGVYEAYDVESIMRVAQEFHLKVILNHVTRSQEILDEIAAWKVPVIVGPIYDLPRANERYDAVYTLPAELQKRGVKIAISSGEAGGPGGAHTVRNLPYSAGFAVAYGLPYDEGLKAITLNVAEMFGFGDKLGSLDVGKSANIVLANGDPLDVRTDVKQVYIEGVAQPMVSRQTILRDEYAK